MDHPHATMDKRAIADRYTILRVQVGSGVHGVTVENQDDRDEMGICIEPPEYVIGLRQFEQYEYRTQPVGHRSGPGDLDLVIYSLRKWMRLALQGNPTVLLPLFVPDSEVCAIDDLGHHLRDHPEMILSRQCGGRFIGYLRSQREQLVGIKSKRHTNRPELVETYGFDCYLDDTEFLTRRGWLMYDQVLDEPVATVNPITAQVEFQRPIDRVTKSYDGPILHHRNSYGAWAVTPNHRMLVSKMRRGPSGINPRAYSTVAASWGFRPASEITRSDWFERVACARRTNEFPVSDALLSLIGAYVSEGCVSKRLKSGEPSVLRFEQKDGGRLHSIMEAVGREYPMRRYRYPHARPVTIWTLADRRVAADVAKSCGEGSSNKRLPEWTLDLSGKQADVLLEALLAGDGTPCRAGGWVYYTNSKRLADDVQTLSVLAGRRANLRGPYRDGMYQVLIQDAGQEVVSMRGRDVASESQAGARIVCFTVPNETLITRRAGKVTMHGNTKFAYHMVRLGLQGVELLTTGRVTLPMPEPWRTWLRELRLGQHTKKEALEVAENLELQLAVLMDTSPLPAEPDRRAADEWLVYAYQRMWDR